MATWRCPHCGTPQAETSRCWACSRSPMTCRTCLFFRRSVAGRLGFCALDRQREALSGEEMRPCWQAPARSYGPQPGLFAELDAAVQPHSSIHAQAAPAATDAALLPPLRTPGGVTSAPQRPPTAATAAITVRPEPRPLAIEPAAGSPPAAAGPSPVEPAPPRLPASLLARRSARPQHGVAEPTGRLEAPPAGSELDPLTSPPEADRAGRLVDAPVVAPSRRLASLADRRAWSERRSPIAPSAAVSVAAEGSGTAQVPVEASAVGQGAVGQAAVGPVDVGLGTPGLVAAEPPSAKEDGPGPIGRGAVG